MRWSHAVTLAIALPPCVFAQSMADALADMGAGRLAEADEKLAAIARERPHSAEPHLYRGMLRLRAGKAQEAVALLERAVQLAPANAAAWKTLGTAYAVQGSFERAMQPFQRACQFDASERDACYFYGRNLYAVNRYGDAVEPFRKALRAAPKDERWRVHRASARNFEALGDAASAEREYRDAIRLRPSRAAAGEDPRVDYGSFLFRQGRTGDALAPLSEAAKARPAPPRAYMELGRVLLHLERTAEAAQCLETARDADPRDWAARLLLGRAYLRLGRAQEAEREMQTAQRGLDSAQGSSTFR